LRAPGGAGMVRPAPERVGHAAERAVINRVPVALRPAAQAADERMLQAHASAAQHDGA